MKNLIALLISGALVVSGFGQTRNVLVGTNNAVVQPTNFWSADASNARTGLGLGSAATNPASAFQPASTILSNLTSGGAVSLTNVTLSISNVSNLQTELDSKLSTNSVLAIANISNLQTTLDGKLGTNPTLQISNIASLQTALDAKLTASFPIAISNVSGLQTALNGKLSTNPTLAISNISGLQTNLDSKLSIAGNAVNLTNFPASLLRTTGDASGLTNFPILNQNTTGTASNVTGVVAIANGGTGTNSASGARQNLGLSWSGLTNASAETFRTALGLGSLSTLSAVAISNVTGLQVALDGKLASNGSAINLTNFPTIPITSGGTGGTNAETARTLLGLGSAATNPASAFQPASANLTNLAANNGSSLTNIPLAGVNGALATNGNGAGLTNLTAANIAGTVALASNVVGTIAISNGGSGSTTAGGARTNFGLGATDRVVFAAGFTNHVGIGLGSTNNGFAADGIVQGNVGIVNNGELVAVFDNVTGMYSYGPINFNSATIAATTRTNLGLGWPALTNTNAGTGLVSVNTNGDVVSPTNFWQRAPIQTLVQDFTNLVSNATNNLIAARNIYAYSMATNVSGVTNTLVLPTDGTAFNGDNATIIHRGTTNTTTVVRQAGATNNFISLNQFDEAVKFVYENNAWTFYHNISYVEPIKFSGTNASANAATSRTNLGLGATWLTNTNATNFRTAIGVPSSFGSGLFSVVGGGSLNIASGDVSVVSGGSTNTASATSTFVGGGFGNTASTIRAVVVGGYGNTSSGESSFIGCGSANVASGEDSFVGAGEFNTASGSSAAIGGGFSNVASGVLSTIGGGVNNNASGNYSVVAGGSNNVVTGLGGFVGGGHNNSAFALASVVGGNNNNASGQGSSIVGGGANTASGFSSTVIGSGGSVASGTNSVVIGGNFSAGGLLASGNYSVAIGGGSRATNNGAFVWSDSQANSFSSTNENSFNVRAIGGMSLDLGTNGIIFRTNASAAATRTNLGLGAASSVEFNDLLVQSRVAFFNTTTRIQRGTRLDGSEALFINLTNKSVATFTATNFILDTPISFSSNSFSAETRTNLGLPWSGLTNTNAEGFRAAIGLDYTNDVFFGNTTVSNGTFYVYKTNVGPFEGLANLMASNNTTLSNETMLRVGLAEQTNRAAQFGFRVARTNNGGEGFATFSVFGYNALMMIGPSDRSRTNTATNAGIEADIYSISPTNKVMTLITTNTGATLFHRPIEFGNATNEGVTRTNIGLGFTALTNTNIPSFQRAIFVTNTTPAAAANLADVKAWLEVSVVTNNVTNSFRLPLFQ